ncbi:MAG: hypothetical protein JSR67_04830 [Proteobacteria bacterium]|nr:hypothetical protein [Pseudomonadota bacterium]
MWISTTSSWFDGLRALAGRRTVLSAVAGVLALVAMLALTAALVVARIPERQAALQELIRRETGLDLSFRRLSVAWGWYGPEAVFHDVTLADPRHGAIRLQAPQLRASLDVWRMARSGNFELARITLTGPDIELATAPGSTAPSTAGAARQPATLPGADVLARWRGGRIDIEHGMLHWQPGADGSAASIALPHLRLQRFGAEWVAQGRLLPPGAGSSVELDARMTGDPRRLDLASGTLTLAATRLDFAPWQRLLPPFVPGVVPRAGAGDLDVQLAFVRGALVAGEGRLHLGRLEWQAPADGPAPLQVTALSGRWSLARGADSWRVVVRDAAIEMPSSGDEVHGAAARAVSGSFDLARDGAWLRGVLNELPLPLLASVARASLAPLADSHVEFDGQARQVRFDWDRERSAGSRLLTQAQVSDVAITDPDRQLSMRGMTGTLRGYDARITAQLGAVAAVLQTPNARLDGVDVSAQLTLQPVADGLLLEADGLQLRREDATLVAQGSVRFAGAGGAAPRLAAEVTLRNVGTALLASLCDPAALAAVSPLAARVSAGQISSARLQLRGGLDRPLPWSDPAHHFSGEASFLSAALAADGAWPGLTSLAGKLQWDAGHVRARIDAGTAGPPPQPDGVQLYALAGLPPLTNLRGTLALSDGRVQRSSFSARWLGGPVNLGVEQRRGRSGDVLVWTARGRLDAPRALQALAARGYADSLTGSAQWTARLSLAAAGSPARWQLRADSNLAGIGSTLPEPFAKSAGSRLPLRIGMQGEGDRAGLHVNLGERARALAALAASSAGWRIERGALQLGAGSVSLPPGPVVAVAGRVSRLALPAFVGLWRDAARDAVLPPLQAQLAVSRLGAAGREFPDVTLSARAGREGIALQLASDGLGAELLWPHVAGRPVRVHLQRFDAGSLAEGFALAQLAGPGAVRLSVDQVLWQHRPVGGLQASLTSAANALDVADWRLSATSHDARGRLHCGAAMCRLAFTLDSHDPAAALAAWGLRPEVHAQRASLGGELTWSSAAPLPLATLEGRLNMQIGAGTLAVPPAPGAGLPSFALLGVPPLLAGLAAAGSGAAPPAPLQFRAWTADYLLGRGVAHTSNLQFDGDAQIAMRGDIGLAARDFDLQAVVLRGEERLPEPVRPLAALPKVAALWLSLREWLSAGGARPTAALQLRGSWDAPMVTTQE